MSPQYTISITSKLPPLILHPFSDASSPGKLMQGSRASLMLQGILPNDSFTFDELEETLLEGKLCEIRMLCYVGKDLLRWIEQCVEFVQRERNADDSGVELQSFAVLLLERAPEAVTEKLKTWGVQDYRSIFLRALGLNALFATAPERNQLTPEFIRNYQTYAESMYEAWLASRPFVRIGHEAFDFDLFASAEYSRMLEAQWSDEA